MTLLRLARATSVAAAFAVGACSSNGDAASASNAGAGGGHPGVDAASDVVTAVPIEIEPASAKLALALGGAATQTFHAYEDGGAGRVEVTSACRFSLADASFGAFAGATLSAKARGGVTKVVATCPDGTGLADLTIDLAGETASAGVPANSGALFGAAAPSTDAARTPVLEYPIDGAALPSNLPAPEIQWTTASNDLFLVSLDGPHVDLDYYVAGSSLTVPAADWSVVLASLAGGELTVSVTGLAQASPTTAATSAVAKLRVSRDRLDDTALYWWVSSKGKIETQTFGETSAPGDVKGDCTSCHSLSRSGTRIGYSRCVANDCGQLFAGFMRFDPTTKGWTEVVDANQKAIAGSYTTFSPLGYPFADDARSLALVSMKSGTLALYDPDTGSKVASNVEDVAVHPTGSTRSALMADWSPDGRQVVFVSTPHGGQWIDLSDGSLATMTYDYAGGSHVFGEPATIVAAPLSLATGEYTNFFFPSYSPDGRVLVFDAARASWRNSSDAKAPGQRLLLGDPSGAWVTDLVALNGSGDLDVTWPHWAPDGGGEFFWVVFASQRPYGHVVTPGTSPAECRRNGVAQCKQIWIAAIDKSKIPAAGAPAGDPSFAPVWLPGQDAQADNISPYWTVPATKVTH